MIYSCHTRARFRKNSSAHWPATYGAAMPYNTSIRYSVANSPLTKSFRRLIATAKVTPITFHGLRHTHISHLLMEGVHVKVVSERAGHANGNITLGVYAADIPNMQGDATRGWTHGFARVKGSPSWDCPVGNRWEFS